MLSRHERAIDAYAETWWFFYDQIFCRAERRQLLETVRTPREAKETFRSWGLYGSKFPSHLARGGSRGLRRTWQHLWLFMSEVCSADSPFRVVPLDKEGRGLGVVARSDVTIAGGVAVKGLSGRIATLPDDVADDERLDRCRMAPSRISSTNGVLVGPLSVVNHSCESKLEWTRLRPRLLARKPAGSDSPSRSAGRTVHGLLGLRAKPGRKLALASGEEVVVKYGAKELGFTCHCGSASCVSKATS